MIKKGIITLFIAFFVNSIAYADEQIQSSMVKIFTSQDNPSYANPWNSDGITSISGSGVVISNHRIITNAHVVSNNTFIQVRAHGKAKKYEAEVTAVSHESDLAILRVKNSSFFDGITPLDIGVLPEIQQPIVVCGFPTGGDTLSMTTGVVSRIEHQEYVHSFISLLAIQIDAAMNSGNSGGPALSEDKKIVGISMQTKTDADNIAYLIPSLIINQFLKDIDDGNHSGIPTLGILTQEMENLSLRELSKMHSNMTGCLVTKVISKNSADGYLKINDVLLSINGSDIADDETISFRPKERTNFRYCTQHLQLGDIVELKVLRNGREKIIKIPLINRIGSEQLVKIEYDTSPTYYIYNGVVFNPLTLNYLQCWGDKWRSDSPNDLLSFLYRNWKDYENHQIVILNKVLPSDINAGYHNFSDEIVESINGRKIRSMNDLLNVMENEKHEFIDIHLISNNRIVIKNDKKEENKNIIMERYKIKNYHSNNLVVTSLNY